MLVIPRRHEPDFFALAPDERAAIMDLAWTVQADMREQDPGGGINVGLNIGAAAGQTVWHAHLHLIPRAQGDVEDPRGGVRSVVPGKAVYPLLTGVG
jgi:diadenosine tetraphosphate (Ap4A) HIT family hydrolase